MKLYMLSGAVGLLVGVIYGVLDVKSPAPPVVALIGLLGMLGGEQIGKKVIAWCRPASSPPPMQSPPPPAARHRSCRAG